MAITKDRVMYAADTAKPYLGRAITDEEFRDNLRSAFAAARAIYEELSRQRGISIAATAATDEDIHSNLRSEWGVSRVSAACRSQEDRMKTKKANNAKINDLKPNQQKPVKGGLNFAKVEIDYNR